MKVWDGMNHKELKVRRLNHIIHDYSRWEMWGSEYAERYCKGCGKRKRRRVYFL